MRRHKRLARHTEAVPSNEQGSIVVEASLVMPIVILVLLVFVMLIRLCAVQMALHAAASQSVRQIAAHIHPANLVWQQAGASNPLPPAATERLSSWSETAADVSEWLPAPAGMLISSALRGDWSPLRNMAATEIGRTLVEPIIRDLADKAIVEPERLSLKLLTLPDLQKAQEPYLVIEVEYEFPLELPFTNKPIVLREQAAERVWISDASAAAYGSELGEAEAIPLQIVSIEPTPLRPGRKATLVVKTKPNAAVSLEVLYKSGSSKAKHLGEAVADTSGYVQWTWLVSGNTTPGTWELTASAAKNSNNKVSRHFLVEKSS